MIEIILIGGGAIIKESITAKKCNFNKAGNLTT